MKWKVTRPLCDFYRKDPNTHPREQKSIYFPSPVKVTDPNLQRRDSSPALADFVCSLSLHFKRRLSFTGLHSSCWVLSFPGNGLGYISPLFLKAAFQKISFAQHIFFWVSWWGKAQKSYSTALQEDLMMRGPRAACFITASQTSAPSWLMPCLYPRVRWKMRAKKKRSRRWSLRRSHFHVG